MKEKTKARLGQLETRLEELAQSVEDIKGSLSRSAPAHDDARSSAAVPKAKGKMVGKAAAKPQYPKPK